MRRLIVALALMAPWAGIAAETKCVEAEGVAPLRGSEAAAKEEAFAAAKWRAMEKAAGVRVQAKTVLQNFRLLDQAITKQAQGVVQSAEIREAFRAPDGFHVVAHVCVRPASVDQAIAAINQDTGVVVFVIADQMRTTGRAELRGAAAALDYRREFAEMNPVAERLIDELTSQRFAVYDALASESVDKEALAAALEARNFVRVRTLLRALPAGFVVFGKIETSIRNMKGADVGYGLSMPGYGVDAMLRYRLLHEEPDGRMRILGSGTVSAHGIGASPEMATEQAMQSLADEAVPEIETKIAREVKGLSRPIRLVVDGIPNTDALFAIKDRLQLIPWVERVDESPNGVFTIRYPDKTIYLANAIA
ncbi:MAG: hypothetical protein D6771_08730, partial [Zetaproteobacteria bacterium]